MGFLFVPEPQDLMSCSARKKKKERYPLFLQMGLKFILGERRAVPEGDLFLSSYTMEQNCNKCNIVTN